MAETLKTLAQLNPSAALTTLYTVPAATSTVCSSIVICNQSASVGTFRISVAVAGEADSAKQYIYYDQTLAAKSTFIATIGMTLAATDVVRVFPSSASMSFNLFGSENT
jgi:hypothetical protein